MESDRILLSEDRPLAIVGAVLYVVMVLLMWANAYCLVEAYW
jgi:hypothetical protein